MTLELLWTLLALALLVVGLALAVLAVALVRLASDARRLVAAAERLLRVTESELPATLASLRSVAGNAEQLSGEAPARVARLDALLDEADRTVRAVQAWRDAADDLVASPSRAVSAARARVRSLGEELADRAGRFGRS